MCRGDKGRGQRYRQGRAEDVCCEYHLELVPIQPGRSDGNTDPLLRRLQSLCLLRLLLRRTRVSTACTDADERLFPLSPFLSFPPFLDRVERVKLKLNIGLELLPGTL